MKQFAIVHSIGITMCVYFFYMSFKKTKIEKLKKDLGDEVALKRIKRMRLIAMVALFSLIGLFIISLIEQGK